MEVFNHGTLEGARGVEVRMTGRGLVLILLC